MKVSALFTSLPLALVSAAPLAGPAVSPIVADGDFKISGPPPPMWNIRCPREVQGVCTPDDKLFYCTVEGRLFNQLSATCSECICRSGGNGGRPSVTIE